MRHWFISMACFVGVLLTGNVVWAAEPPHSPLVVAHRGLLKHAPENTLANFRACIALGMGFEFDVARTKDGHLVVIHDDSVDRTTNGTGKVAELTLQDIRKLDAGSWFDTRFQGEKVPTLSEVFALIAENQRPDLIFAADLKTADVESDTVKLADEHGVTDRLLFIGRTITHGTVRQRIRQVNARAHTAVVVNNPGEFDNALNAPHANWVYFRYIPVADEMARAQKAGKPAFIAGVTVSGIQPDNWKKCHELGIKAVLTDYPLEFFQQFRPVSK